jgi:hypothetical protein
VAGKSSFSGSVKSLKQKGRYLLANPGVLDIFRGLWTLMISNKEVIFGATNQNTENLIYLKGLIEAGKLK